MSYAMNLVIQWLSKGFATQERKKETKKAVTNANTAMSAYHPISPVIKLGFCRQGKEETMNVHHTIWHTLRL